LPQKKAKKATFKEKAKKETVEWIKAFAYAAVAVVIIRLFVFETMMVPTPSMDPTIAPQDRLFIERITYQASPPEYGDIVVFWTPFIDKSAQEMLRFFDKFMDLFSPARYKGHVKYVKRLIGKPGDVLQLVPNLDNPGTYRILVNGKTPAGLTGIAYTREGVFSDPSFYHKMAYPDAYQYLSSGTVAQFRNLNEMLDYTDSYEEVFGDLEVDEYAKKDASGSIQVTVPEGCYFFMGDNSDESFDSRFFGFVPVENVVGGPLLRIWPLDRFGPMHRH